MNANAPIYLSPVLGAAIIILIVGVLFWIFWIKTGKLIFDDKLSQLKDFIDLSNVTQANNDEIDALFNELTPHGEIQEEKKKKLWTEFQHRFYKFSKYKID